MDKVFPTDELIPASEQLAQKLADGPIKAITMIKVAMKKSMSMDLRSSLDYTINLQYMLVNTADHKEAFTAFLEKRKPVLRESRRQVKGERQARTMFRNEG